MAIDVGTKVFRVYQPYLTPGMDEIKQGHIDKVVFSIRQWYEQNGQRDDDRPLVGASSNSCDFLNRGGQSRRKEATTATGENEVCEIRCWGHPYNRYDPCIDHTNCTSIFLIALLSWLCVFGLSLWSVLLSVDSGL